MMIQWLHVMLQRFNKFKDFFFRALSAHRTFEGFRGTFEGLMERSMVRIKCLMRVMMHCSHEILRLMCMSGRIKRFIEP
jgi:hypothetical protein